MEKHVSFKTMPLRNSAKIELRTFGQPSDIVLFATLKSYSRVLLEYPVARQYRAITELDTLASQRCCRFLNNGAYGTVLKRFERVRLRARFTTCVYLRLRAFHQAFHYMVWLIR